VFRAIRRLSDSIQLAADQLEALVTLHRAFEPALDRLAALELRASTFEADVHGMLLKADGKLKAANNAEQRERQLKKSYQRESDLAGFDPDGDPEPETVRANDVAPGEEERLYPLRVDVADNNKAHAQRAKWGR